MCASLLNRIFALWKFHWQTLKSKETHLEEHFNFESVVSCCWDEIEIFGISYHRWRKILIESLELPPPQIKTHLLKILTKYSRENDDVIALYWLSLSKLRLDEFSNIGKVSLFFSCISLGSFGHLVYERKNLHPLCGMAFY